MTLKRKYGPCWRLSIRKEKLMELKGKTAIVTGAGRGIGEGIAMVLARKGANVIVDDLKITKELENVVKKITSMGGQAFAVAADVTRKDEVQAMVEAAIKQFGSVDILVNNAGIEANPSLATDLAEEQWDRVLNVNLKGVFLCCQAVIPQMMKQKKGRIVNIGAIAGVRMTYLGGIESTCSKHGLAGLTNHLAWELADSNITVNTICPGGVLTPLMESMTSPEYREMSIKRMVPLGRFTTSEEIGEAVSFFASDQAAMITGQELAVDGGMLTGFGEDLRAVGRNRIKAMKDWGGGWCMH
jgi:NAD(P)-dependent dehydrogenase (short-subunit alcohol dehydrogenase family)